MGQAVCRDGNEHTLSGESFSAFHKTHAQVLRSMPMGKTTREFLAQATLSKEMVDSSWIRASPTGRF